MPEISIMNMIISASIFVSTCLFTYNQFTGKSNDTSVTTPRTYTNANITKATTTYSPDTFARNTDNKTNTDLPYKGYATAKHDNSKTENHQDKKLLFYKNRTDGKDNDNATAKTVKPSNMHEQKNNNAPKVITDNIKKPKYNDDELKEIKSMIGTCYEHYNIACQYRESDDLVLEAKKLKFIKNRNYIKINVKDMCKKHICRYDNDEQNCFEKHNYYLLKNIRGCEKPHCVSSAVTHINNEADHKQILVLNDISKLKFRGFYRTSFNKDPIFVSSLRDLVLGSDMVNCDILSIDSLPEISLNFIKLLEDCKFPDVILGHSLFIVIYKEMVFIQARDSLAYLIVKKNDYKDIYMEEIAKYKTNGFAYEKDDHGYLVNYKHALCKDKKSNVTENAETRALRAIFYPFCINYITGVLENEMIHPNNYTENKLNYTKIKNIVRIPQKEVVIYRLHMTTTHPVENVNAEKKPKKIGSRFKKN